jgi:uncharacterized protein (DUF1800 family)
VPVAKGGLLQELENDAETAPESVSDSTLDARGTGAAVALSALALSACGGGGGGSSGPPVVNPPPPVVPTITDAEAARFLLQAQFAVTDADLTAVKSNGYPAYLNSKFSQALGQTGVAWLDSQGYQAIDNRQTYFWPQFGDFMIWNQLLAGPDQMRKRMALALSEFFVVSLTPIDGFYPPYVIGAYWDLLCANVFGNFRTLLEKITLNAGMGFFLNTKGNLKEDNNGRQPDENYAREVMQLFTIGLVELNQDGTPRLDANNKPIETYGQSDITNLARVFTGYDWDFWSNGGMFTNVTWHDYDVPNTRFATNQMLFRAQDHSNLAVSFLGKNIPANTAGPEALRQALDHLFNHANVGPFFCKQMIQRLVTSNPSPAYVSRVAAVFNNDGTGVRGDLKAVWRAILTDTEARTLPTASNTMSGKLREPVVRWVQAMRTIGFSSTDGKYIIYETSPADQALGQSPLRSPSVFNFFRPGYIPPNTEIATAAKQAPEFQILNETTSAGYINWMQWTLRYPYNDVTPNYSALLPIAHDIDAVLAWLNLRLTANQLSSDTLSTIRGLMPVFAITQASTNEAKLNMLSTVAFMITVCPEYLVQK